MAKETTTTSAPQFSDVEEEFTVTVTFRRHSESHEDPHGTNRQGRMSMTVHDEQGRFADDTFFDSAPQNLGYWGFRQTVWTLDADAKNAEREAKRIAAEERKIATAQRKLEAEAKAEQRRLQALEREAAKKVRAEQEAQKVQERINALKDKIAALQSDGVDITVVENVLRSEPANA